MDTDTEHPAQPDMPPIDTSVSDPTTKSEPGPQDDAPDEPPKEVMSKLQEHLERVQRDLQTQQRQQANQPKPSQRQFGSRFKTDVKNGSDSGWYPSFRPGNAPAVRPNLPSDVHPQGHTQGLAKGYHDNTGQPWPQPPQPHNAWSMTRHPRGNFIRPGMGVRPRWSHPDRLAWPRSYPTPGTFSPGVGGPNRFNFNQPPPPMFYQHHPQSSLIEEFPPLERPTTDPSQGYENQGQTNGDFKIGVWQDEPQTTKFTTEELTKANVYGLNNPSDFQEQWFKNATQPTASSLSTTIEPSDEDGDVLKLKQVEPQTETLTKNKQIITSKPDMCDGDGVFTDKADHGPVLNAISPPRKDRSFSGPKTPPGLKFDSPLLLNSPREIGFSLQNTLLAGLKLRLPKPKISESPLCSSGSGADKEKAPQNLPEKPIVQDSECKPSAKGADEMSKTARPNSIDEKFDLKRKAPQASDQLPAKVSHSLSVGDTDKQIVLYQGPVNKDEARRTLGFDYRDKQMTGFALPQKQFNLFISPFANYHQHQFSTRLITGRGFGPPMSNMTSDNNCSRCQQVFKWPHLLACCHRFCYPCLAAMYDETKDKIQCPSCRTLTHTDPSLTSLRLDLHKCREMVRVQINPFMCTQCSQNHGCVACYSCPAFLCMRCQEGHRFESKYAHHTIGPVSKVGYNANGELHPTCPDHIGMLLGQFCIPCRVMVCFACLQSDHAKHDICDLNTARSVAEKRIREINYGITHMIELCQKRLQNFNLSKQKVEATVKVARNNIHKNCNELISDIDTFEKKSKKLTGKAYDAGIKHLEQLKKEAMEVDADRRTFESSIRSHIKDGTPQEVTAVLPLFSASYKHLSDFYTKCTLVDPDFTAELKFDPLYPEFNNALSRMSVELSFEENSTLESLMQSSLAERALVKSTPAHPYENVCSQVTRPETRSDETNTESSSEGASQMITDDVLKNFTRRTVSNKFIFGKYGRGDYEFAEPSGVCFLQDGSLAVCDAKNHRITIFDENGKYLRTIGQAPNLPPLPNSSNQPDGDYTATRVHGSLYFPFRLAQCPLTNNLVIVERPPSTDVQVFTPDGTFIRRFGQECLRYPRGITVDEHGQVLVIESRTMKVFIFSPEGVKLHAFYLSMHLEFPNDIAASGGNIFISDNRTHCVHVYDYNLDWQRKIGDESLTYFPIGVALDHASHVIIADNHNTFNISVFNRDGSLVCGFKSEYKHANCYNMALHPRRKELAVTTKDCKVVMFDYSATSGPMLDLVMPRDE